MGPESEHPRHESGLVRHPELDHHGSVISRLAQAVFSVMLDDSRCLQGVDEHPIRSYLVLSDLPRFVWERGFCIEAFGQLGRPRPTCRRGAFDAVDSKRPRGVTITIEAHEVPATLAEPQERRVNVTLVSA